MIYDKRYKTKSFVEKGGLLIMEELQEAIVEKRKKNKQKSGGEAAAGVRAVFYMENKKTLSGCISLPVNELLNAQEIVKDYQKQLSNIKLGKDSTLTHHAFIACFGNLCIDMQKCIGFEVVFFQKDHAGVLKPVSPMINPPSELTKKEDGAKSTVKEEVSKSAIKEEVSEPAVKEDAPESAVKEEESKSATKDDTSKPAIKGDASKAEEISIPDAAEKMVKEVKEDKEVKAEQVVKEIKEDKATLPLTERKGSFVSIPDEGIGHTSRGRKKTNEELRTKDYRLRALGIVGDQKEN